MNYYLVFEWDRIRQRMISFIVRDKSSGNAYATNVATWGPRSEAIRAICSGCLSKYRAVESGCRQYTECSLCGQKTHCFL